MIFIKNFILKSERDHFPIVWDCGESFMSSKNQQNWNCRDHKTVRFARNVICISSVHHFHLVQKLQSSLYFIQKIVKSCGCVWVCTPIGNLNCNRKNTVYLMEKRTMKWKREMIFMSWRFERFVRLLNTCVWHLFSPEVVF